MEVGGEGDYTPITTVTTRMTSAIRWAAMRAILKDKSKVWDDF